MGGFEPPTSRTLSEYANRTAPHPDNDAAPKLTKPVQTVVREKRLLCKEQNAKATSFRVIKTLYLDHREIKRDAMDGALSFCAEHGCGLQG